MAERLLRRRRVGADRADRRQDRHVVLDRAADSGQVRQAQAGDRPVGVGVSASGRPAGGVGTPGEHAERRGRRAYATLGPVHSARARRARGELDAGIAGLLEAADLPEGDLLAVSGASGAHNATAAEKALLDANPFIAARGFSSLTGHLKEAQFPFAVALAALAVANKAPYSVFDAENEKPSEKSPQQVLATAIGYHQFEGMALVGGA